MTAWTGTLIQRLGCILWLVSKYYSLKGVLMNAYRFCEFMTKKVGVLVIL